MFCAARMRLPSARTGHGPIFGSRAMLRPTPTPIGTDAVRRAIVEDEPHTVDAKGRYGSRRVWNLSRARASSASTWLTPFVDTLWRGLVRTTADGIPMRPPNAGAKSPQPPACCGATCA